MVHLYRSSTTKHCFVRQPYSLPLRLASPRLTSPRPVPSKLTFLKQLHLWDMTEESVNKARHRPFPPRWLPYYSSVQTASWYLNFEFSSAIFLISFQDSRHTNEWYTSKHCVQILFKFGKYNHPLSKDHNTHLSTTFLHRRLSFIKTNFQPPY